MMAISSHVRSTERREGVSIAEVVMDDMAIGNPVPCGPASAFEPLPRHPYSAVPLPSNWELWRNFPVATQQSVARKPMLCRRNDGLDRPKPLVARVVLDRPLLTVPFNCRWRGVQYDGIVASAARG